MDEPGAQASAGGAASTGLNRRDLMKAAAIGGAVWSMPTIVATATPAAASGTLVAGCYKYMWDWRWASEILACYEAKSFSAQNDAVECGQNTGENHEKIGSKAQRVTNPNCCQERNPDNDDNDFQWWEIPDIPPECIEMSIVSPAVDCAASGTGLSIKFKVTDDCPTCFLADYDVYKDSSGKLVDGTYTCDTLSVSGNNGGSSGFYKEITFNFTGSTVPVWFKFWVGCGLTTSTNDQYVPNTDCPHHAGAAPNSPVGIS